MELDVDVLRMTPAWKDVGRSLAKKSWTEYFGILLKNAF